MRVLIAPDSFKGSLGAAEAAAAMRRGIEGARPDLRVEVLALADGGDGTAAVLAHQPGARWNSTRVCGPLPDRCVTARWLRLGPEGTTAVVELAAASGLALLTDRERDPLRTTTRGTGELVRAAVESGADTILLALGGSATVDGGTGAARALGWRFLDADGADVPEGGGHLHRIETIVPPDADALEGTEVTALCDVDTPLLGPAGAARTFGPQKGADAAAVARLDAGLAHLAERIAAQLGIDVTRAPGTGAAGGMGAGALAFFGARLTPGVDAILQAVEFDRALAGTRRVVTGEGRFDATSLRGKVVGGVVEHARRRGIPVSVLAGSVAWPAAEPLPEGVDELRAATPDGRADTPTPTKAAVRLEEAATRMAAGWPP